MARHLLERTLSADQAKLAEYYAQGSGLEQALAMGIGCVPSPRADMDPAVADALGIAPSGFLEETQLAHILGGKRADGAPLPGDQREVIPTGLSGDRFGPLGPGASCNGSDALGHCHELVPGVTTCLE